MKQIDIYIDNAMYPINKIDEEHNNDIKDTL